MRTRGSVLAGCLASNALPHFLHFLFRQSLQRDEFISRALGCSNELIQLGLQGRAFSILRILNEKDHRNVTMVVPVLMISCQVSE